jgi:hypothetical protein
MWGVRQQLEAKRERLEEPRWFRNFRMSDQARQIERNLGIED